MAFSTAEKRISPVAAPHAENTKEHVTMFPVFMCPYSDFHIPEDAFSGIRKKVNGSSLKDAYHIVAELDQQRLGVLKKDEVSKVLKTMEEVAQEKGLPESRLDTPIAFNSSLKLRLVWGLEKIPVAVHRSLELNIDTRTGELNFAQRARNSQKEKQVKLKAEVWTKRQDVLKNALEHASERPVIRFG